MADKTCKLNEITEHLYCSRPWIVQNRCLRAASVLHQAYRTSSRLSYSMNLNDALTTHMLLPEALSTLPLAESTTKMAGWRIGPRNFSRYLPWLSKELQIKENTKRWEKCFPYHYIHKLHAILCIKLKLTAKTTTWKSSYEKWKPLKQSNLT